MDTNIRVLRIPLPVDLIRKMDALVLEGRAGLGSRADFIREAVEAMTLELTYGVDEATVATPSPSAPSASNRKATQSAASARGEIPTLATTALGRPEKPAALAPRDTVGAPSTNVIFGMHNRDYPSLWAARRLCDVMRDGPRPYDDAVRLVGAEAWDMGRRLVALDTTVAGKPSAMFPTNEEKRQSADDGFRTFAIGHVGRDAHGAPLLTGPLFDWRVCSYERRGKDGMLTMTDPGFQLVQDMAALTVAQPHPEPLALRFFGHLRKFAPGDWATIVSVCACIADRPDRAALLAAMRLRWSGRTEAEVATNASGYVARAREWGLVEPKQKEGRYALTSLGERLVREESAHV